MAEFNVRIEEVEPGYFTIFSEDGWETYYFGESYSDCEQYADANGMRIVSERWCD